METKSMKTIESSGFKRLEFLTNRGCFFLLVLLLTSSMVRGQTQVITLDSVSVTDLNDIIIGWTIHSNVPGGYVEVHRRLDNGLYAVISKVPMRQSYYIDNSVNPQDKAYSYYIVAWDTDGNPIDNSATDAQQTIYLEEIQAYICDQIIVADWQNYLVSTTVGQPVPLDFPFESNHVRYSFNDTGFLLGNTVNKFTEQGAFRAAESGKYCVKIRSVNRENGISSTSNVVCVNVGFPFQPEFIYISGVSVESGATQVGIFADSRAPNPGYVIERFNDELNRFITLDTIYTPQEHFFYEDVNAQGHLRSETYRVLALDSCGVEVLDSDEASSVFLRLQALSPSVNVLDWREYSGWPTGAMHYSVQRQIDLFAGFEDIATLGAATFSFTDDLTLLDNNQLLGEIHYRIEAVENIGNPYGLNETVYSNVVVVDREIDVFIPTAFKPSSQIAENRIFRPVFSFFTPAEYSFTIYNKWGQQIFNTDQIDQAWDGNHSGAAAAAGVYSYIVRFADLSGKNMEKRGTMLLIR